MGQQVRKYTSAASLELLGAALRAARASHVPPLRLADIGEDEAAPRSWSHSHLSKIERGKEVPSIELVLWYESRTGVAAGSLVTLWEHATGETYTPAPSTVSDASLWAIERLEMELDLRGELPLLTHTRDLLANGDADSYWIKYDTKDLHATNDGSSVVCTLGGEIVERTAMPDSTVEKARIDIGGVIRKGEWHRVRVVHQLPAGDIPPYLDFSLRTGAVREVQMTVMFPEPAPRVLRFTDAYAADLTELVNNPFTYSGREPVREELTVTTFGSVSTRFSFPAAGFHHGLIWSTKF